MGVWELVEWDESWVMGVWELGDGSLGVSGMG